MVQITQETIDNLKGKISNIGSLESLRNKKFPKEELKRELEKLKFNEKEIKKILNYASDILYELQIGLDVRSWSGSPIPYYERRIQAVQKFFRHNNPKVSKWAKKVTKEFQESIQREKLRQSEREWGIVNIDETSSYQ